MKEQPSLNDRLHTDAPGAAASTRGDRSDGYRSPCDGAAWMRRIRLTLAALCLIAGLWLTFAQPWIDAVTALGRPQAL